MNKSELLKIRTALGKTQKQMGQILGISIRTVQSFEQGLRKVPIHIERQSLLLLSLKKSGTHNSKPCWEIKNCPDECRESCPAWEFNAGHLCWLINGTICQGTVKSSWKQKMAVCRKCTVFQSAF